MRRALTMIGSGVLLSAMAATSVVAQVATPVPGAGAVEIVSVSTLPTLPIGVTLNAKLGEGTVTDDLGIPIGGTGSDLWRAAGDPDNEYWMVTDRGPNVGVEVDGDEVLTFPVPAFTPMILHVRLNGDAVEVLDVIPLVGQSGAGVSGVSNLEGHDLQPYGYLATETIPFNPSGLDVEGLVRMPDGGFWVADEYGPSLVKVDATGTVVERHVPQGLGLTGADYPVKETLPGILASRRGNRGFEGLGMTPDGSLLMAAIQSPLSNPDGDTGESSRLSRILTFDPASGTPVGEYAYLMEEGPAFDTAEGIEQGDMKLSGVIAIDRDTAIVLERTDDVARLYTVEFAGATDLLGTAWDDAATSPSLEAGDPSGDVVPLAKTLLADLSTVDMPAKIEGIALAGDTTIAAANDNDFDLGSLENGDGVWEPGDKTSQIILVTVAGGLPAADLAP